jgi:general secretion pathway protein D
MQANKLIIISHLCIFLASCASLDPAYVEGRALADAGKVEEALAKLEAAAQREPRNTEYRAALFRQRLLVAARRVAEGDAALARGDGAGAEKAYAAALAADSGNVRAASGLARIQQAEAHRKRLDEAEAQLAAQRPAAAEQVAREVLNADPQNQRARELAARIASQQSAAMAASAPGMGPAFSRPITIEFRDTTLRAMFEALSRTSGLNFVFDKDVRTDTKVTLFLRNTRLDDVVRMVLMTNQLERRVLNDNTLLIYPNTPAKQKDYQELAVRSFYLGNADVKQTLSMIRAVVKTRDVYIDEKLNLLVMRDTPDAIRLAEKLIAAQDLPEPEALLEVEVLEVKRSKLQEIGINWPNTFTALNIVAAPSTTSTTGGVVVTTANATTTTTQLTVDTLRNLSARQVGVSPNPSLNVRGEASDVNILANPRIRVKNREKARVHIGDRVPVITTTATANVGVAESVQYLDVGLRLEVEPLVYLDQDVGIKVNLEVSSIVREVRSNSGTLTYQIGTRNTTTSLRVRDGETQILAGLINDEDRTSANRIPGLGELPLLNRIFGSQRDERSKTEIVLLITPRVVRNIVTPPGFEAQVQAGTESAVGAPTLRLLPTSRAAMTSTAPPGAAPARAPAPSQPDAAAGAPQPQLQWKGAEAAQLGGEYLLAFELSGAGAAPKGRFDLVFDPAVFAAEGVPAGTGRLGVNFESAAGSIRLRVVAKAPGEARFLAENLAVELTPGTPVPAAAPPAARVEVRAP